jgi:hypothetical protein
MEVKLYAFVGAVRSGACYLALYALRLASKIDNGSLSSCFTLVSRCNANAYEPTDVKSGILFLARLVEPLPPMVIQLVNRFSVLLKLLLR